MLRAFSLSVFTVAIAGLAVSPVFAGKRCSAGSGVVHVAAPRGAAPAAPGKDIVDTAVGAGSFDTLVAAVTAAGLVDTLKGKGPYTVFAPTDEAFAALPAGTLDGLLKDKEKLKKILLYHVVPGSVKAADVVKLTSAKTAEGSDVKIVVADGKVKVNDANVVKTDVAASNGVIHVIDKVILPPAGG